MTASPIRDTAPAAATSSDRLPLARTSRGRPSTSRYANGASAVRTTLPQSPSPPARRSGRARPSKAIASGPEKDALPSTSRPRRKSYATARDSPPPAPDDGPITDLFPPGPLLDALTQQQPSRPPTDGAATGPSSVVGDANGGSGDGAESSFFGDLTQSSSQVLGAYSLEPAAAPSSVGAPRIQAFAKLEFEDGQFYMNTYSVCLGRDIAAERMAILREHGSQAPPPDPSTRPRGPQSLNGRGRSRSSRRHTLNGSLKLASSVVSESGGIINLGTDPSIGAAPVNGHVSRDAKSGSFSSSHDAPVNGIPPQFPVDLTGPSGAAPSTIAIPSVAQDVTASITAPKDVNDSQQAPNANNIQAQSDVKADDSASLLAQPIKIEPTSLLTTEPDPQPVDAEALKPSPQECPLIPIHPPAVEVDGLKAHRGISRRHVEITYNFEKELFEAIILGRNGAFIDEVWYGKDAVITLKSGSYIQISGVAIRFVLPEVDNFDRSSVEGISWGSRSHMSLEFEDGLGDRIDSREPSESGSSAENTRRALARRLNAGPVSEEDEDDDDMEDDDEDEDDVDVRRNRETASSPRARRKGRALKLKGSKKDIKTVSGRRPGKGKEPPQTPVLDAELTAKLGIDIPVDMIPPRRKGPGRPPKNGFMSKREEALLKRQAKERAKAQAAGQGLPVQSTNKRALVKLEDQTELSIKDKSRQARRRREDDSEALAQSIEADDGDVNGEADGERATSNAKAGRKPVNAATTSAPAAPPQRSPTPTFDIDSLTEEQKSKPTKSYVMILHEILTQSEQGPLSLSQIYHAIIRRYPYFKVGTTSNGWQSSVRHNLGQHAAFVKVPKEGKGHLWAVDPEYPIEQERRRRPSPPPASPQVNMPPLHARPGFPPTYGFANGSVPLNGFTSSSTGSGAQRLPAAGKGMPAPPPGVSVMPGRFPAAPNGSGLQGGSFAGDANSYQSPYSRNGANTNAASNSGGASHPSGPVANIRNAPFLTQGSAHRGHNSSASANQSSHAHPSSATTVLQGNYHFPSVVPAHIRDEISKFKQHLVVSLSETPNAENIVNRAIDSTLGIGPGPRLGDLLSPTAAADAAQVDAIAGALKKMLQALSFEFPLRNVVIERTSLTTSTRTPPAGHPDIARSSGSADPGPPRPSSNLNQGISRPPPSMNQNIQNVPPRPASNTNPAFTRPPATPGPDYLRPPATGTPTSGRAPSTAEPQSRAPSATVQATESISSTGRSPIPAVAKSPNAYPPPAASLTAPSPHTDNHSPASTDPAHAKNPNSVRKSSMDIATPSTDARQASSTPLDGAVEQTRPRYEVADGQSRETAFRATPDAETRESRGNLAGLKPLRSYTPPQDHKESQMRRLQRSDIQEQSLGESRKQGETGQPERINGISTKVDETNGASELHGPEADGNDRAAGVGSDADAPSASNEGEGASVADTVSGLGMRTRGVKRALGMTDSESAGLGGMRAKKVAT